MMNVRDTIREVKYLNIHNDDFNDFLDDINNKFKSIDKFINNKASVLCISVKK